MNFANFESKYMYFNPKYDLSQNLTMYFFNLNLTEL